jgi:hypothetical protein
MARLYGNASPGNVLSSSTPLLFLLLLAPFLAVQGDILLGFAGSADGSSSYALKVMRQLVSGRTFVMQISIHKYTIRLKQ